MKVVSEHRWNWLRALWRRRFSPDGPWWFGLCSSVNLAMALGHSREEALRWQGVLDQLRLGRWLAGEKF
jgi:hypothetical protein